MDMMMIIIIVIMREQKVNIVHPQMQAKAALRIVLAAAVSEHTHTHLLAREVEDAAHERCAHTPALPHGPLIRVKVQRMAPPVPPAMRPPLAEASLGGLCACVCVIVCMCVRACDRVCVIGPVCAC